MWGVVLAWAVAGVAMPARARVVVVGVDGGSWNLIDPMMAAGELPNLAALAARGITGRLATVEPVNSPAVWTSLATGRTPRAHGVTAFLVDRHTLRVPTTWERLAASGLRVGLYDYLVTWPARELPGGFVVPGWLRRDDTVAPVDLFAAAGLEPYAYSMDGVRTPDEIVANSRRELAEKPPRFVRLLERHDLDLGVVTFYSVDATSHRLWAAAFPDEFDDPAASDPAHRDVIREVLQGIDAAVGRIAAALGPEDTLLVVSDHGFQADDGVRRVWVGEVAAWTAAAGLDPKRDRFQQGGFGNVAFVVGAGPFAEREVLYDRLYELVAGLRGPDGEPLYDAYRLDVAPRPPGAERGWWEGVRQWGLRVYLEWLRMELDHPAHGYVFARPLDGALLAAWPDAVVRIDGREAALRELVHVEEFSGTHDPTGILLAAGPAIARRSERVDVSVLEISPLLFYLTGRPLPDDLDAGLPEAILDPAWRAAHRPERVPASRLPGLPEAGEPASPRPAPAADDDAVTERLRALGYVE